MESAAPTGGPGVITPGHPHTHALGASCEHRSSRSASAPRVVPNTDSLRHVQILNVPRVKRGHATIAVEVRLLSHFEEFNVHWCDGRSKTRPCWGHDECPHCQADGHDVRRVAYAPAEVYEYDSLGRRSAKLIALYVPEKQIPIAKAIPIGAVVKLTRVGSGMGEKLRFDLISTPGHSGDLGRIHEPFGIRAFMVKFWFKGPIPKTFVIDAPDNPIAALAGLPLTPPLPFVEAEESAADFLMSHFKTNTLAGAAAALREQLTARIPATQPEPVPAADVKANWQADEITWHDGPAAGAKNRMEVTQACQRISLAPFAKTYEIEMTRTKVDYQTMAKLLEAAGESKAGLLLRETASRRFDGKPLNPQSCTGKPKTNPKSIPHSDPAPQSSSWPASRAESRPASCAESRDDGACPATSHPSGGKDGAGSATGRAVVGEALNRLANHFEVEV